MGKGIKILKLVVSILVCQAAGLVGSLFTAPAISTWYITLQKPSFNPPSWIFAPVWTLLFLLMGISLFLVWKNDPSIAPNERRRVISLFFIQLFLNVAWSILFFGLRFPLYAFIEIVILWLAILMTIISFYKVSKTAVYLLLPYILWVSFAAVLNFSIAMLNL